VRTMLQNGLRQNRISHAYIFSGPAGTGKRKTALALAQSLFCLHPDDRPCGSCIECRTMQNGNHARLHRIEPSGTAIKIEQIRDLLQTVYLKPTQAPFKVATIVAADRLTTQAANAFLKTLEEPPADSILILLSTEPQRMLETILSRCLRLSFGGEAGRHRDPAFVAWLENFSEMAAAEHKSLLGRYQLLSVLLNKLNEIKEATGENLSKRSPLETHDDVDAKLKEKWEDELSAAIEAEYRRQRAELLTGLQWWLRDVWLQTLQFGREMFTYPNLAKAAARVAGRVSPQQAMENLQLLEQTQRLLASNVQEALALEVGLLKLKL